jgi:HSP20 family protein
MDSFLRDTRFLAPAGSEEIHPVRRPVSDVYETGDSLVFTMELPGFDKSEIEVNVNSGYLEVKGERKAQEKEDRTYRQVQRWHGRFQRSFRLPRGLDREKVSAELKNGVLSISVPKLQPAKPKQIAVRVN